MPAGTMRVTVAVRHPQTLEVHALVAGEAVPEWAEGLVHEGDVESVKAPAKRAAAKSE